MELADHLRCALACIADADPGPASSQSLAHEMARVAQQALGLPTRYPLNLGSVQIGMVEQPDGSIKIVP